MPCEPIRVHVQDSGGRIRNSRPDFYPLVVSACGNPAAVRRPCNVAEVMPIIKRSFQRTVGTPYVDHLSRGRCEPAAIRAPGRLVRRVGDLIRDEFVLSSFHVPDSERPVFTTGSYARSLGVPGQGADSCCMTVQDCSQPAVSFPDTYLMVFGGGRQLTLRGPCHPQNKLAVAHHDPRKL